MGAAKLDILAVVLFQLRVDNYYYKYNSSNLTNCTNNKNLRYLQQSNTGESSAITGTAATAKINSAAVLSTGSNTFTNIHTHLPIYRIIINWGCPEIARGVIFRRDIHPTVF